MVYGGFGHFSGGIMVKNAQFYAVLAYFGLFWVEMGQNSLKIGVLNPNTPSKVPKTPLNQNTSCSKYFSRSRRNFGFCDLGTYAHSRGANRPKNCRFWPFWGHLAKNLDFVRNLAKNRLEEY